MLAICVGGCGAMDDAGAPGRVHPMETRTTHQELRPTDASDPRGYDGVEAKSIVSPGGSFKVWWVEQGEHAPPMADADNSGVPDYVEMVARVADKVADTLQQGGWKLAKNDDPGGGMPAPGGDGLFDIYLVNFTNGDGHYVPDWCAPNAKGVQQCAGHFLLENDFAGLRYPSPEYAAKLVLSHEYFHAVQAAYVKDLPGWWSEGSATWFEEYFNPDQSDFENLTTLYFDEPERSLNDRQHGPSDAHAYGAAIFVYFLEQHIGADGLRKIFEQMADGQDLMAALKAELTDAWAPLADAFDLFATYNLFTGSRAVSANGYPDAQRFQGVDVTTQQVTGNFNWDLDANPLGARYARLEFDQAITLQVGALANFPDAPEFIAVNHDEYAADGTMHTLNEDTATRFDPAMSPLYVVVANGHTDARRAATLKVRLAPADSGGDTTNPDAGTSDQPSVTVHDKKNDGGCSTTGDATPSAALLLLAMFVLGWRRRR